MLHLGRGESLAPITRGVYVKQVSLRVAVAAALFVLIAGCGGGGSGTAANSPAPGGNTPTTPETITGVATPSSVSVVTATNAN